MAEFKIDGRMKVKKLKELFKDEFQGTLRVYNGPKIADDNDTLAAIRGNEGAKGGSLVCRSSRTVGKFIEDMWNTFGIKVKIASPDDWVLALDVNLKIFLTMQEKRTWRLLSLIKEMRRLKVLTM